MRIQTKEYEVYTLDEVLEKAIERQWDINVDYEWWGTVHDDAEMVGIKIDSFDIDRASYCNINVPGCAETAHLIMDNHGTRCDTYKLAEQFLADRDKLIDTAEKDEDGKFVDLYELDGKLDDIESEFIQALSEEYRIMLQHEYEYLTSAEAIEETLRANDYEFYADGSIA